ENPCVTGSIPVVATESTSQDVLFLFIFVSMLEGFLDFIEKNKLCDKSDHILLAVSGGVDSVVMAELFHRAGWHFSIIHCNFQLRAAASDADEQFVRTLAQKYNTTCFVKSFDTRKYATRHKFSIQQAARKLRYDYFEEIRKKENFDLVGTAHHADDQIETFFINLFRGSGIAGLAGIPIKQQHIIRPLLFAFRSEIESFAAENNLGYRTDESNNENKYLRNKIRNLLMPQLENLSPSCRTSICTTIGHLKNTEQIYRQHLKTIRLLKKHKNGLITIDIRTLKKLQPSSHYLFEYISVFGFNSRVCNEICQSLDEISGKIFFSPTHRLVKDRDTLIIDKKPDFAAGDEFVLEEDVKKIDTPVKLHFLEKNIDSLKTFIVTGNTALIDKDKLTSPMTIRRWRQGDYFYPLGMNFKKKLSDFFTDNKLSVIDKENVWLLCSGEKIVWIIGYRTDNRFKITARTQNVIQIKWMK
ncbi:MAG TPA: tRNA lysidine(34) synthetase TilS, partial [Bacteroidales bacterium]|nr:tRNA lysidine(34) synthetase TilS [Bacteroidales bacterium]